MKRKLTVDIEIDTATVFLALAAIEQKQYGPLVAELIENYVKENRHKLAELAQNFIK